LLFLAVLALAWWLVAQRGIGTTEPLGGTVTVATPEGATQPAAPEARQATATRPAGATRSRSGGTSTATPAAAASRNAALLAHAQPRYPVAAARRGAEGTVMLQIAIDANGMPTDIGYAQRSGDPDLDRAARTAARDWRFRPALRDGRAVATTVNVPVRFVLPSAQG
jgi:TonB family protein